MRPRLHHLRQKGGLGICFRFQGAELQRGRGRARRSTAATLRTNFLSSEEASHCVLSRHAGVNSFFLRSHVIVIDFFPPGRLRAGGLTASGLEDVSHCCCGAVRPASTKYCSLLRSLIPVHTLPLFQGNLRGRTRSIGQTRTDGREGEGPRKEKGFLSF